MRPCFAQEERGEGVLVWLEEGLLSIGREGKEAGSLIL